MLNAARSLDFEAIEVAFQGFTSFVLWIEHSMIRNITGQTITIVIASLAVIGTVRTVSVYQSIHREWGETHDEAYVIFAEVVFLSTGQTIGKVFAGETLRRTACTFRGKVLEVPINRNTPWSRLIELPEIHCAVTSETKHVVLACIAVKRTV